MKSSTSTLALFIFLMGNFMFAQEISGYPLVSNVESNSTETTQIVKYQYYPNLEAYFNRETLDFIFKVNGEWTTAKELPSGYRGYSIFNGYRVDIKDYFEDKPYEKLAEHKKQFPYFSNDRKGKLAALKAKQMANLNSNQIAVSD